ATAKTAATIVALRCLIHHLSHARFHGCAGDATRDDRCGDEVCGRRDTGMKRRPHVLEQRQPYCRVKRYMGPWSRPMHQVTRPKWDVRHRDFETNVTAI